MAGQIARDRNDSAQQRSALFWIVLFVVAKVIFHTFVNTHYGFHRDELATLDDARHLAWGYVAYPPLTPFVGAIELAAFGESTAGFRLFAAIAQTVAIVLTADICKQLGGSRIAQWVAALAVVAGPVSLASSSLFQYVSFDLLWWVLIAWSIVRLIKTEDQRYWLAVGAAIGFGFLTKYTIGICIIGLFVGFVFTPLRKQIKSKWLWAGVALALAIALPNIIWQIQNDFISVEFLKSIHARDVAIGRTDNFLKNQLWISASFAAVPLWLMGWIALMFVPSLRKFRAVALMALSSLLLFAVLHGRDYYTAPIYPPLIAAGSTWLFSLIEHKRAVRKLAAGFAMTIILISGILYAAVIMPIAPIGSDWFRMATNFNGDLREEFGWQELTEAIARVWSTIPSEERPRAAIFCGNYGEAGAIDLFGPQKDLPKAISAVNSFWKRGYGELPPETVVAVGFKKTYLEKMFGSVELADSISNPLGIANEESEHPEIYICRYPRRPWNEVWPTIRSFG